MKKYYLLIGCLVAIAFSPESNGQAGDGEASVVDDINRAIDRAVAKNDFVFLEKHYGDDFVFTHSTGLVDSKESWIRSIKNMGDARYAFREHDSTTVEMHNDIAIISGKLSVARESKQETHTYNLYYVRVFALRNDVWQMISHRSTREWH